MKKIPAKCLTCAYSYLNADDVLMCNIAFVYDNFSPDVEVEKDGLCEYYELNEEVRRDVVLGMPRR